MPCSVKGSAANAPCWWQPMAPSTRAQLKRAREEEEERRCRLFLEGEGDGPLLQLCACHGSAKLVHRHCLEKWRRTCPNELAGRSLPLRRVQGPLPRCAEPRATQCTAPGRARGWPEHCLHLEHTR